MSTSSIRDALENLGNVITEQPEQATKQNVPATAHNSPSRSFEAEVV